jgi:hypothetical protein
MLQNFCYIIKIGIDIYHEDRYVVNAQIQFVIENSIFEEEY